MIGLGSNRLTVCRRGGMSVTQAGRGGMEWLAGGRRPRWASPYSAAATAALKAQFPTQWPTIRDYGFAHPEIVPYMNAYAPEDAKIAYSLVAGLGIRAIINGAGAWLDTEFTATGGMLAYIGMKPVSGKTFEIGSHNTSAQGSTNNYNRNVIFGNKTTNRVGVEVLNVLSNNTIDNALNFSGFNDLEFSTIAGEQMYLKVNNTTKNISNPSGTVNPLTTVVVNYGQYGGSPIDAEGTCYSYLKLKNKDKVLVRDYVPFKRNGQMGLLDLLSGSMAVRTGTFTELIIDPS